MAMKRLPTYGSVCSGIEAASIAWEPMGWAPTWFSEIEPFPSAVLAHRWPTVHNHGDFTKIAKRVLAGKCKAPDILVGGTPCFTAGHQVLTEHGYRNIETLEPGDRVVTHTGKLQKIVRIGHEKKRVGTLKLVGNALGIQSTPDHPFLTCDLKTKYIGKGVAYHNVTECREPEWVAASESVGKQWCALKSTDIETCDYQGARWTEAEAMTIAGWYLGDGWIRRTTGKNKKSVVLGVNRNKYNKFKKMFYGRFGTSKERTGIKIFMHDTELAEWLIKHFGEKSGNKRIPAWVMSSPYSHNLLEGYLSTDGTRPNPRTWTINTVSRGLGFGIRDLAQLHGWVCSISLQETPDTTVIEGRVVNQRDYYSVRAFIATTSRKSRTYHNFLLRKITSWEFNKPKRIVYNIEVAGDNSYVLDGAVVHNCQAYSLAGLRQSLDDARGQLTLSFVKLAEAIDAKRKEEGEAPAVIVWENVPGVLSTKDNAFGCFLAGLAGEDLPLQPPGGKWSNSGYVSGPKRNIAWRVLDAQYFGVPQRRKRVFVVASAGTICPAEILFERQGVSGDSEACEDAIQETSRATGKVLEVRGNGTVITRALPLNTMTMQGRPSDTGRMGSGIGEFTDPCPTLTKAHSHAALIVTGQHKADSMGVVKGNGQEFLVSGFQPGVARTLTARHDSSPCADRGQDVIALMPMSKTLPPYQKVTCSLCASDHKGISNQYVTDAKCVVATGTFRDKADCLTAAYGTKWNGNASATNGSLFAHQGLVVRRLTPLECERLQGFPDNHTLVPFRGKPAADGVRYRACGNSMAVPCMNWIGLRIHQALGHRVTADMIWKPSYSTRLFSAPMRKAVPVRIQRNPWLQGRYAAIEQGLW